MKKPIIMDFDNTMGLPGCDVDDGLALLYLLGRNDVDILGLCTTYGNSTLDAVHENTLRLKETLGFDIPIMRGSSLPHRSLRNSVASGAATGGNLNGSDNTVSASDDTSANDFSEAARFIAATTGARSGDIKLIATGSTTNLADACALDAHALDRTATIDLMGGITQTLVVGAGIMDELNFSIDADATLRVLHAAPSLPIAVATANHCLPAFFTQREFEAEFGACSWLARICQPWFNWMKRQFGTDGWICWDIVAAAHSVAPKFFEERPFAVTLDRRLLSVGYLEETQDSSGAAISPLTATVNESLPPHAIITTPVIREVTAFKAHVFDCWHTALEKFENVRLST